ncbi:diacylglycerol O-acyltransferase 3 [Ipomoea triloba]|uniref:diacylglycerol O-acyltransferase 3 n=1 Tax=Ipomoea triloba TaxID=35885 RepID=UPI00125DA411|nr:diacylglycerol O-acyltransferase 3 [Ipomoea triloba]
MDAYATAGVFRRVPYAVSSGIGSRSSHHAKIPFSVGRKWLVSGFTDEGHLGYYSTSRRRIRCEVESETMRRDDKVKDKKRKKMLKKRSKLLKNLSKDLSTLTQIGFGMDCSNPCDLIDQDQEKKISEAAETLLAQLQKLRANECEDSSSSSSESSDSECEGVANMNKMKPKPKPKPKPVAEKAPLMLSTILTTQVDAIDVEPVIVVPESQPAIPDSIISLGQSAGVGGITKEDETTTKKIEVCMGGKCKKLGAEAILEELERVVEMEGGGVSVCGCKCLGKCKVGPNLRLSSSSAAEGLSESGVKLPPTRSLRLGVGVEDASLILRQELGLAASSSLVD